MATVAALTADYIEEHRSVKDCLALGVVNYSALSRLIIRELGLEGGVSTEAVLIAARRYHEKLRTDVRERALVGLLDRSNVEIKNNIMIYTLGKSMYPDSLLEAEKAIRREGDIFFSIEGTRTITVIIQRQSMDILEPKIHHHILDRKGNLMLVTITSKGIDATVGAVNHISGLFFNRDINIEEFMSCHDDTLIVVDSSHMGEIGRVLGGGRDGKGDRRRSSECGSLVSEVP